MNEIDAVKKETLKDLPIFCGLETKNLRQITQISRLVKFPKNKIVFLEAEEYRGFYIVLKGKVKIFKVSLDGKENILHLIKPPHTFAEVPMFEGGNYPASAQTLEESILLFIPKDEFLDLIQKDISLSLKMIAGFAKRLKSLSQRIEDISSKDVTYRLAKYLIEEIEKNGTYNLAEPFIRLSITKSDVASFLGTITETLSRTFKKLQNENVIRVEGKKIFIKDYSRLKDLAK
jgi:CRP/FNR family transcriptional regulator